MLVKFVQIPPSSNVNIDIFLRGPTAEVQAVFIVHLFLHRLRRDIYTHYCVTPPRPRP